METLTIFLIFVSFFIVVSIIISIIVYINSLKSDQQPQQQQQQQQPQPQQPQQQQQQQQQAKLQKPILKNTDFNDEGGGNAIYLDRHTLSCNPYGINKFQLVRDGQGKYKYDYTCDPNIESNVYKDSNTGFNEEGGGKVGYLDRHILDCGSSAVISSFKLNRSGNNTYRYDYQCITPSTNLQCRDVTTPITEDGGGNAMYLDRHDVKCNEGEAISKFQLIRPNENSIQYTYKCCKKQ